MNSAALHASFAGVPCSFQHGRWVPIMSQNELPTSETVLRALRADVELCEKRIAYLEEHPEVSAESVYRVDVRGEMRVVNEITYQRSKMLRLEQAIDRLLEVASL